MTCLLGADIDFVYRKKKGNHHENETEHPSIEKYLRTLMAKKLHGALLVPQINIYHKGCGTLGVPVFASENIELTFPLNFKKYQRKNIVKNTCFRVS